MAFKNVEWTSFTRLSCAGCAPADVILCTTFTPSTVPAQMISFQQFNNGCGQKFYRYVFSYDTEKLPAGVTGLTCANITGAFCKGCLTTWVEELLAGAIANLTAQFMEVITTIFAAIEAAKAKTFSDSVREASFSFLADPTTSHDVDLLITNPSSTRPMRLTIGYGFAMDVEATDAFNDVTMTGQLQIDGSDVSGEVGTAEFRWTVGGDAMHAHFAAPGGVYNDYLLAAGASVTARLHLTSTVTAPAPDEIFAATGIYLAAFGVTEPA